MFAHGEVNLNRNGVYPTALRDSGQHGCSKEYLDVEGQVPLGLYYFYDGSAADKLRNIEPPNWKVYCSIAGDDADFLIAGDIPKLDFRP